MNIISGNNDQAFRETGLYAGGQKVRNIIAEIDLPVASTFGPYLAKIGKSREQLNSDLCLKVGDT